MERKKKLDEQVEGLVVALEDDEPKKGLSHEIEKTRMRRKSYVLDLRIQSPAALGYLGIDGIDTAPALVRLAKVKGIDVIAVADYFSSKYIDRITAAARGSVVTVLPGVTLRCTIGACDDVILTCLFPEHYTSAHVSDFLRALQVPQAADGDRRYRITLPFGQVLKVIDQYSAAAIPSRMDKTPSRKSVLPLLIERYGFRAFDLAYYPDSCEYFKKNWPKIKFKLLSFSNATALAQVGSRISKVKMAEPGFIGIRAILEREGLPA